jgi:hypothetical protein
MFESSQLLFFLFVVAIGLVGYDMRAALKPPVCPECPHCAAEREAARQRDAEVEDWWGRRYGLRRPDDEDHPH